MIKKRKLLANNTIVKVKKEKIDPQIFIVKNIRVYHFSTPGGPWRGLRHALVGWREVDWAGSQLIWRLPCCQEILSHIYPFLRDQCSFADLHKFQFDKQVLTRPAQRAENRDKMLNICIV